MPTIGKFRKIRDPQGLGRRGRGMENYCLTDTQFLFGVMKNKRQILYCVYFTNLKNPTLVMDHTANLALNGMPWAD